MLGVCGAVALVESFGGDLGGAGHRVAVDTLVKVDCRSLGRHRGVAFLR